MGAFTAQSRQRKPTNLTLRWWSETAGCAMKGQKGNRDRRPCSPTAECQTNLDLSVRSAIFPGGEMERQRNAARGKWPCSRLILMPCTGRSLAVLLLCPRRQAEPRAVLLDVLPASNDSWANCFLGRTQSRGQCVPHLPSFRARTICVLTVSTVCGRWNERKRTA